LHVDRGLQRLLELLESRGALVVGPPRHARRLEDGR